jgi:hypothetical protein
MMVHRTPSGRWRRVAEVGLAVVVLAASFGVFSRSAQQVESRGDEWLYIYKSRYFANLVSNGGPANPEWADGFFTHDHPMMLAYALGAWFTVQGRDVFQMPTPRYSRAARAEFGIPSQPLPYELNRENFIIGPVPDPELLQNARVLMAGFAAGAALLIYLIGRALAGPVAGLIALLALLSRRVFTHELVWVQNESLLVLFILGALLLAILGARRGVGGSLPIRWAVPLGIVLGLGLQTKLTAVLSLLSLGVWMIIVAAAALRREGRAVRGLMRAGRLGSAAIAARGWLLALGIGVAVFVLSNPHLYPDPIAHARHQFDSRARVMEMAPTGCDADCAVTLLERVGYTLRGSLMGGVPISRSSSLLELILGLGAAGLAALGFGALGYRAVLAFRDQVAPSAEGIVPVTALVYLAGVSAGMTMVGITRYVVPTAVLAALLAGVGAAVFSQVVLHALPHRPSLRVLLSRAGARHLTGHA